MGNFFSDTGEEGNVEIFLSATKSDNIWETFVPSDYQYVVFGSGSLMVFPSKKQLYFSLCDSSILLDRGKLATMSGARTLDL
ncbi:hypothetical protein H5410_022655 [Solanum commersonii]|uniref:Uncharacterized protein n=1 Tax=Solanum commersonii TaxID=4109 RepID=A0A9J5ZJK3_SOLCO|nr:hypothetical protein H5410_022655 [Solanum commersonii]